MDHAPHHSPHANASDHLALAYYRLGTALNAGGQRVNAQEFERLATQSGLAATLDVRYKSMRVARFFNEPELIQLCRRRDGGRRVSWTQIVELLQVPTARARKRYAALAVRDQMTAPSLREKIRRDAGRGSLRPRSGRKRREPGTALEALRCSKRDLESLKFHLEALNRQVGALPHGTAGSKIKLALKTARQIARLLAEIEAKINLN